MANDITLGDNQPIDTHLKPIKVGGKASPIEVASAYPDESHNAKVKIEGDLEVTGDLKVEGEGDNFITDVQFAAGTDVKTFSDGTALMLFAGGSGLDVAYTTASDTLTFSANDGSTSAKGIVQLIDEDDMATDSATRVPTQQSVKAYVDANAGGSVSDADTTTKGIVELATTAETTTGTDTGRAVTPDGLKDGYEGSANVTTLGTIATGTWNGTAVANDYVADLPTSKITSGTMADARIASSNVTQHQGSITGTGALNSGSITSGFGNIDNGSSTLDTGDITAANITTTDNILIPNDRFLRLGTSGNEDKIYSDGNTINIAKDDSDVVQILDEEIRSEIPIKITEAAAAVSDTAGKGQIWVKNDTPNNLYFTNDAGNDVQITNGSSLASGSTEFRQIINAGFNYSYTGGTKVYLPLVGYLVEVNTQFGRNEFLSYVAPYDGRVTQVIIRSEEACGSTVVGFHKSATGTEHPNATASDSVTVDMSADDTPYKFAFTGGMSGSGNQFSAGEIINISFDPTNDANDSVFTVEFILDSSSGL